MNGFNTCTLVGNLVRNPELRYTPSGTAVFNGSLAINRKYKQGDDVKEEVTYIDVVAFGRTAENACQYLSKGSGVLVHGRIQQRRWETDDGQKRSKHEVVAETINFLTKSSGGGGPQGGHIDDTWPDGGYGGGEEYDSE